MLLRCVKTLLAQSGPTATVGYLSAFGVKAGIERQVLVSRDLNIVPWATPFWRQFLEGQASDHLRVMRSSRVMADFLLATADAVPNENTLLGAKTLRGQGADGGAAGPT